MNWMAGASSDPIVVALRYHIGEPPLDEIPAAAAETDAARRATIETIAPEFGATRAAQNKAMADYFGVTVRTVQRWRTTGTEKRAPKPVQIRRLVTDRAQQVRTFIADRLAAIRRAGLNMRITATIRVSQAIRTHVMPQRLAPPAFIPGSRLRAVTDHWRQQRYAQAGDQLLSEFFRSYWGDPDPVQEMGTIDAAEIS